MIDPEARRELAEEALTTLKPLVLDIARAIDGTPGAPATVRHLREVERHLDRIAHWRPEWQRRSERKRGRDG